MFTKKNVKFLPSISAIKKRIHTMNRKWKECQSNNVYINQFYWTWIWIITLFFFPIWGEGENWLLWAKKHNKHNTKWRETFDQQTHNSMLCIHTFCPQFIIVIKIERWKMLMVMKNKKKKKKTWPVVIVVNAAIRVLQCFTSNLCESSVSK